MSNSNLELNDLTAGPSPKDVIKFRLGEINKIKDCLNAEIKEGKDIVKKIVKYIAAFDYADKLYYTICIVWHLKYCVTCDNLWNTFSNSWSIFNFNIYRNDWRI